MARKPRKPKILPIAAPSFAVGAVREVTKFFSRHQVVDFPGSWEGGFTLIALEHADALWWALREPHGDIVGGGRLWIVNRPAPVLREALAGLLPEYQGKGWYPKILRSLRVAYGRPIESDNKRSLHNDRMWRKVGVPTKRGYRINPGR